MIYMDERQVSRIYAVEAGERTVTWSRGDDHLAQSMTVTAQPDGTLVSVSRMSQDRGEWTRDLSGRTDGPGDAIAHGILHGPVELFAADAAEGEPAPAFRGGRLALLGTAEPATLHAWFTALSDGANEIDELQERPWGDSDGTLVDRFGVAWLIGYQPSGD
jgi:PhnB protein